VLNPGSRVAKVGAVTVMFAVALPDVAVATEPKSIWFGPVGDGDGE